VVDLLPVETLLSPNLKGGDFSFLGHPIELGPAQLQIFGQLIKSEPIVGLQNHLSITIK